MINAMSSWIARPSIALGCLMAALGLPCAQAQAPLSSSFDDLVNQAAQLEAGYFQQELELRREEIGLLRQELELKRYEIQLLRKQMEPKQAELYELRRQIEAEQDRPIPAPAPRPSLEEKDDSDLYRWCQVTNVPWRTIPSGGAVVQDGNRLGTFFNHAVLRDGVLFVWARC